MKALLPSILLALLATACGTPPVIDEGASFHTIPPHGWAYGDVLEFSPRPLPDSCLSTTNIAVAVRHTDAYLYGNLWLEVSTPAAEGDSMVIDTINVALADVYGKWLGRGNGISYIALDTLPAQRIYRPGRPTFVRHIMRADTLHDIEQIGLIYYSIEPLPQQPDTMPAIADAPADSL